MIGQVYKTGVIGPAVGESAMNIRMPCIALANLKTPRLRY
jgi:hypothetical protein